MVNLPDLERCPKIDDEANVANTLQLATEIFCSEIDAQMGRVAAPRILLIVEKPSALQAELNKRYPTLVHQSAADLQPATREEVPLRWDLVLLADTDGQLTRQTGVLAFVRDRLAKRMVLWNPALALSDALAHGLRCVVASQPIYLFDLYDYKQRPEWFNAEHFAHPDQWKPVN